ncbi:MAG: glycosyltransferase [Desulfamplus sp.]|nr:glycosyltransferase [Desulfamplus sp.]
MNEPPLVSVVIITYNQKIFLRECIESILEQDYENIEIVVADDASTDGTQEMLKEYALQHYNKFNLVFAEKNQGITQNSNAAFFACKGKYVAMLGGDDLLLHGKIRKQVDFLETHKDYVLCGSYTKLIDKDGKEIGVKKDFKNKIDKKYVLSELIESGNYLVPVVSYMFRRDAAPREGFDLRLPVASDSLFMCHVASKGKIYILKETLTAYRVHNSYAKKIGYIDDSLVSLALCNFFFPECYFKTKKALSRTYYRHAKRIILEETGNICKAKHYLKMSINESLNIISIIILILLSLNLKKLIIKLYHGFDTLGS